MDNGKIISTKKSELSRVMRRIHDNQAKIEALLRRRQTYITQTEFNKGSLSTNPTATKILAAWARDQSYSLKSNLKKAQKIRLEIEGIKS